MNNTIGTRIVLRNTHSSLLDGLRVAIKSIGFEHKLPDCITNGVVIYVDDDGTFDSCSSPSSKESNPERITIEVNDGNVSQFLRCLEQAMKAQKNKVVSFSSEDGTLVVVRADGAVTYGCTTVSTEMVKKILAIRKKLME